MRCADLGSTFFAVVTVGVTLIGLAGCDSKPTTAPRQSATLPANLRLLTWNLHRCEAGVDRVEAQILAQRPDFVFLQEAEVAADAVATDKLLPHLAGALGGFHIVSASTLRLPKEQHCDVAILSRWPIRSIAAHALDEKGWVYAIEGVVVTDGCDLTLMSVHTHATWRLTDAAHVRESTDVRTRQIDAIVSRARASSSPVIVAGDFNAPAGTPESGRLVSGLIDLASPESTKATVPAALPMLRLDYILANRGMKVEAYAVVDARLSDHRPVMAVIDWALEEPAK